MHHRYVRWEILAIFKRKEKLETLNDEDLMHLEEISSKVANKPISFGVLMAKAYEKSGNPIFGIALNRYKDDLSENLASIESEIINEAVRLLILNLLDDLDNDEYIEQMEMLKERLKSLRKLERTVKENFIQNENK